MFLRKVHPIASIINGVLVDLPTPPNITYFWNFGSLLGITLIFQIVTGLLLTTRYVGGGQASFDSVVDLIQDVGWG
jgi:ubiquinol-cytochrome c reductase cytochrome b subunit